VTIYPECQEGINKDTSGLDRNTRSSVMGKIIAVTARVGKNSWLFDPEIGGTPSKPRTYACAGPLPERKMSNPCCLGHDVGPRLGPGWPNALQA
jgi:hypothetical protein